jgi:hypothetical protein
MPIITLAAVIPAIIAEMMRMTLVRMDSDICFSFLNKAAWNHDSRQPDTVCRYRLNREPEIRLVSLYSGRCGRNTPKRKKSSEKEPGEISKCRFLKLAPGFKIEGKYRLYAFTYHLYSLQSDIRTKFIQSFLRALCSGGGGKAVAVHLRDGNAKVVADGNTVDRYGPAPVETGGFGDEPRPLAAVKVGYTA